MAILTALALAAGIGSMAYGVVENQAGKKKAEEGYAVQQAGAQQQAEAARLQAGISKEQAATSVVFAGQERDINTLASQQSISASDQSYSINQSTIAAEQAIEAKKQQAMELDARRQGMEVIRNQQRARALSLATGVAQGGSGFVGGSSAFGGAQGQISGQSNVNLLGINQNLEVGRGIYAQNTAISNNRIQQNDLEHQYALQQAANQTAKANLTYNYAVANAGYTTRLADTQTMMSQGQGEIFRGSGIVSQGNAQSAAGNSFISAGPGIFSMGTNIDKLSGSFNPINNIFGGGSPSGYGTGRMFG